MVRVALDLRRPVHVRLDQDAGGVAAEGHGAGEEDRLAGDEVLRLADVRDDLRRGIVAGGQTAESHRGSHQLEEVAAADAIGERRGLARELLFEELVELIAARELLEAAPVFAPAQVADPLAEFLEVKW